MKGMISAPESTVDAWRLFLYNTALYGQLFKLILSEQAASLSQQPEPDVEPTNPSIGEPP